MSGQVQAAAAANEVATLLIPMHGKQWVVPNVTVAEVIPFVEPEAEEGPSWYLGRFSWRGLSVPVVSFETLNEEPYISQSSSLVVSLCSMDWWTISACPFAL